MFYIVSVNDNYYDKPHQNNPIETTPSEEPHRKNPIGRTPSEEPHRKNPIGTTPSEEPRSLDKTPDQAHRKSSGHQPTPQKYNSNTQ